MSGRRPRASRRGAPLQDPVTTGPEQAPLYTQVYREIREHILSGALRPGARLPSARSLAAGSDKAFGTIIDANVTTLIVAAILYFLGSGPVRGFAVTMGLGVFCTIFTAVYVTQLIIATWFDRRRPKTITV